MTTYTELTDAELDPDQPITSAKMKALRDNPIAMAEGATGAPKNGTGIISGYIDVVAGAINAYNVVPSIDGIGSSATVTVSGNPNDAALDLNVDWSAAPRGEVSVTCSLTGQVVFASGDAQIITCLNLIYAPQGAFVFFGCYDINGNHEDTYQLDFIITYDRAGTLPVGF